MEAANFWEESSKSAEILKEAKSLESDIESFKELKSLYEDIEVLIELAGEEKDTSLLNDIKHSLNTLESRINALRTKTLLFGEYDSSCAILKALKPVIGAQCYIECIPDGHKIWAIVLKYWIFWKKMRRDLSL